MSYLLSKEKDGPPCFRILDLSLQVQLDAVDLLLALGRRLSDTSSKATVCSPTPPLRSQSASRSLRHPRAPLPPGSPRTRLVPSVRCTMRLLKAEELFRKLLEGGSKKQPRLLGLDVGSKYVGLAVSDQKNRIALPLRYGLLAIGVEDVFLDANCLG
ncbi:hypothetical protein ACQJBY_028075 [Aegilops geniculata]